MASDRPQRRVVVVRFPGVQALDVIGPLEVFNGADQLAHTAGYDVSIASRTRGIETSAGTRLQANATLAECEGPIDTLLVAGGAGTRDAANDRRLISWIEEAAKRSRRVASVCTGAFLLARAGLL